MNQAHPKIVAIIEVTAVFLLSVMLFQSLRLAAFSKWEAEILSGQRIFLLEYGTVLGIVLGVMTLTQRNWQQYGLTLQHRQRQFHVIAVGFLPVLTLGGVLGLVNWTTWVGAGTVVTVVVGMLLLMGWALKADGTRPGITQMLVLLVLASGAIKIGALRSTLTKTLYFYLVVGPTEEILFRGYIQSRLHEVSGRPYQFFGVRWGWGLLLASALFGMWHVVWQPLEGSAWLHGMWTFFAGLLFGYVRERSQGVLAASVLHSVMNYMPILDLFGG